MWGSWETWSDCSATCSYAGASRTRLKVCDNPSPVFGGRYCAEQNSSETAACTTLPACNTGRNFIEIK
jgi:hypothetical protein